MYAYYLEDVFLNRALDVSTSQERKVEDLEGEIVRYVDFSFVI
jgi:hypothetical protein